ncbi:MAG: flagellar hook-basal body complex protein [Oscillospiraceae bacterium]
MNRSMYSGVSGMKTHQTRMDVIGNNIANVNTYGFKAGRAVFRDVYYQTLKSATGGTSSSGGTNPSQVGYGSQVGGVDVMMGNSSFQMTDNTMDLAIDGDGFFQVMDGDGNKYFTRSGQLKFGPSGNLVDSQGRFVLGVSGDPIGKAPGSELIQVQLPPVPPTSSSSNDVINNVGFKISASNNTKDGNVAMQFITGQKMTDGVKATAQVGTSGIVVSLNPKETFKTIEDLNKAANDAIEEYMQAHSGKSHPAGKFTISMDPADKWPKPDGLKGEQICSTDFALQMGKVEGWPTDAVAGGFKPTVPAATGSAFKPAALTGGTFKVTGDATGKKYTVEYTLGGTTYTGEIDSTRTDAGTIKLKKKGGTDENDYIIFDRPSYTELCKLQGDATGKTPTTGDVAIDTALSDKIKLANVTAATESKNLGLSSKKMMLSGGTEGGPQSIENLTGISIGADGVIVASHSQLGIIVIGRVDTATFANPQGLAQSGNSYFTETQNSGTINYCEPGTDGAGKLVSGSLELSNVDLSREFADMITTQRGFQASSRLITVSDEMLNELVNLKR